MYHIEFYPGSTYEVVVLVKRAALKKTEMIKYYVDPLIQRGLPASKLISFSLEYNDKNKAPVSFCRGYLSKLLPALDKLGTKTLLVCDATYFKVLTGCKKAEPYYGYVQDCVVKGYEHMKVILGANYQGGFYNPDVYAKLDMSLDTLYAHESGNHTELGTGIIHSAEYIHSTKEIREALNKLHQYDELTCDIEAFSLRFWEAGIGTIGFAWDEHNGIAFPVDYYEAHNPEVRAEGFFGAKLNKPEVKKLLRNFFETYKGKITWHNAGYDVKVMIYELWMNHGLDTRGLLKGLEIMTKRIDDTQIITYLATNSCAGNKLGLKENAHEFAGNYAQDEIKDIRKIPLDELLQYNLIDCLSTWYVKKKHMPTMIQDNQKSIYDDIFIPSLKVLLQIELTGLPLDRDKVKQARADLEAIQNDFNDRLMKCKQVQLFEQDMKLSRITEDNKTLKTKKRTLNDPIIQRIVFNPNSNQQLQELIYVQLGYPVIDVTDNKQPAVGAKTLKKLKARTTDPEHLEIFDCLIGLSEVTIILNTFISAFETKVFPKADGRDYLHGNFKLGGTVSGRLSSSGPNLMNMPSTGTKYAKITKGCFVPPKGWIIMGADFASLEDRISALLTKDPNKLAVYQGHKVYELVVDGTTHHIRDDATIVYDGTSYTGEAFYEKFKS